jgi:hypothetical protein
VILKAHPELLAPDAMGGWAPAPLAPAAPVSFLALNRLDMAPRSLPPLQALGGAGAGGAMGFSMVGKLLGKVKSREETARARIKERARQRVERRRREAGAAAEAAEAEARAGQAVYRAVSKVVLREGLAKESAKAGELAEGETFVAEVRPAAPRPTPRRTAASHRWLRVTRVKSGPRPTTSTPPACCGW